MEYIIAYADAGLCNRLKCLLSVMREAKQSSRTPILYWPKNSAVNCSFSDLFENKIIEIGIEELKTLQLHKEIHMMADLVKTWRLETFPEDNLPANFTRAFPSFTGKDIDGEYERIPLSIIEKYLTYIKQLVPKRHILDEVENYAKNFDQSTVSISIRTWAEYPARQSLFDIKNVYSTLDKIECSNYFVSCDSAVILEKIIKRYGKRVLHYYKYARGNEINEIEDTRGKLCDLLLLAKNSRLFVSYLSTFSEMAWWFGDCRAEVKTIPPKTFFYKRIVIWAPITMIFCILWSRYIPIPFFIVKHCRWLLKQARKVKAAILR